MVDRLYMRLALEEAWRYQLLTYPNPAVGAAVVKEGRLLSVAAHKEAGAPHAEVEAIKEAYKQLTADTRIDAISDAAKLHDYLLAHAKNLFEGATIYVTLEPCAHYGKTPPCALLIDRLGFERIVIATLDPNEQASGGANFLRSKKREVVLGVCEAEAKALIEPFVKWRQRRFVLFKLAQHCNGVIEGGTISSYPSREYVHRLRTKIDLLVIGGSTVRIDRPRLDARLVKGRPPDVWIYSKQRSFDTTIPLFTASGRKVSICEALDFGDAHKFVMIEGGAGMLEATKEIVDWYLLFMAPSMRKLPNYHFEAELEFLHFQKIDRDLMIWSRNG